MSDSNRYIFVTQNKLEDFARYDIGMSDLAEDGNDDSHAGYMEGISVECENSYPIQVTDLITAVENFRDENITIYDFLYEWWYPEALDSLLPKTRAHKVTVADAILAIILNFLCPPSRPIYLTGNALHKFNIPKLFDKQLSITDFNDDVLLRALDAIATYGTSEVYCKISECIVDYLGLKPDSLNMDSTSFHVHCDPKTEEGHIQLTHGYSRDFRPDLPQIVQMLVVDTVSKVPVFMKNIDGNQPDTISFKFGKYVMQQLKAAKDCKYLIADSALCTDDIISDLYENNILF